MSSITTTCPAAISTATNRSKQTAIWASAEWKAFVKYHTERIGYCEDCKKKEGDIAINKDGNEYIVHLTVDHPFRWAYKSKELYLNYELSMCRVVCRTCNGAFERHADICPECLKNYKSDRQPICDRCMLERSPKVRELYDQGSQDQENRQAARTRKNYRKKNPHSCERRGKDQKCKRTPGAICEHNTRNAPNKCRYFKMKKSVKL